MPLFKFSCQVCGKILEKVTKYLDPPPECPECGVPTLKVLAAPSPAQWKCSKGSL